MVYLFVGDDFQAKLNRINELKKEFFSKDTLDFNFDSFDGQNLDLKNLQEALLKLPLKVKKRLLIIKNCQNCPTESKEFLLSYVKNPARNIILILDFQKIDEKDKFFYEISKSAKLIRFKETSVEDAFDLQKAISQKKALNAIKILNNLFLQGYRPEQILGSLRYQWEKAFIEQKDFKKKMELLLEADINIKTTRIKPECALEMLIIKLCQ